MPKSNLIPIPNDKLLEDERARCASLAEKLEQEQAQLRKSRQEWAPAYEKWYSEEIAPLATRARELLLLARDQGIFIRQVEEAARILYCRPAEARAKVSAAARGQVIFEELADEYFETGRFPRGPLPSDVEMHLRLEFARSKFPMKNPAMLEEYFQKHKREMLFEMFDWEETPPLASCDEEQLKRLYRELARRLHPDANPTAGTKENELWHEVTSAFQAQDIETLESILATYDSGNRFEAVDSLARLRGILRRIEAKLRNTVRERRRESREPWWKFGERRKARDREKVASKLRAEQERLIQMAEADLASQAERMRGWDTPPQLS